MKGAPPQPYVGESSCQASGRGCRRPARVNQPMGAGRRCCDASCMSPEPIAVAVGVRWAARAGWLSSLTGLASLPYRPYRSVRSPQDYLRATACILKVWWARFDAFLWEAHGGHGHVAPGLGMSSRVAAAASRCTASRVLHSAARSVLVYCICCTHDGSALLFVSCLTHSGDLCVAQGIGQDFRPLVTPQRRR